MNSVKDTLDGSNANRLDYFALNQDLALARWCNQRDRVRYEEVGHHTLSLYVNGGYRTRRLDQPGGGYGSPGKLCLMPASQDSEWDIGDSQEFVHLYISDAGLKFFALESFDVDPRLVSLPDLTFMDHLELNQLCRPLFHTHWHQSGGLMDLQQAAYDVMGCLVSSFVSAKARDGYLKGGLTRLQLQRVTDYVNDQLDRDLRLEDLAQIAGLSQYHFARMFKESTGLTPHLYINKIRVRRGLELLRRGQPQAQVAVSCGFAHQSHFAAMFKREFGLPPSRYLREVQRQLPRESLASG